MEQTGTFSFCGGKSNMTPRYEAWYEMFPAGSVSVFKVKPGDTINTAVKFSGGKFNISIADATSGKSFSISKACATCERASAEWIIERPALCNNSGTKCILTALANFGTATMSKNLAQVAGGPVKGVAGFNNDPDLHGPAAEEGRVHLTVNVSGLSGPSFQVQWLRSGSPFPITF